MSAISKVHDRFAETTIDDEVVVMDLHSGNFFSISGTALEVWKLIDGVRDCAAIVGALAGRYSADPTLESDVVTFLDELCGVGLLRRG